MAFAKDNLKLNSIAAITTPNNTSSIKLLGKLGMKFEKSINLPGDSLDLMVFYKNLTINNNE